MHNLYSANQVILDQISILNKIESETLLSDIQQPGSLLSAVFQIDLRSCFLLFTIISNQILDIFDWFKKRESAILFFFYTVFSLILKFLL